MRVGVVRKYSPARASSRRDDRVRTACASRAILSRHRRRGRARTSRGASGTRRRRAIASARRYGSNGNGERPPPATPSGPRATPLRRSCEKSAERISPCPAPASPEASPARSRWTPPSSAETPRAPRRGRDREPPAISTPRWRAYPARTWSTRSPAPSPASSSSTPSPQSADTPSRDDASRRGWRARTAPRVVPRVARRCTTRIPVGGP